LGGDAHTVEGVSRPGWPRSILPVALVTGAPWRSRRL